MGRMLRETVAVLCGGFIATVVPLFPAAVWAQGCAMCVTSVDGNDPLARGLNISILFMMAVPFALLVSVGSWFAYMYWRSQPSAPSLRLLHREKEGVS